MFATVTLKKSSKKLRKSYKIEKKVIGETEFVNMFLYKQISSKKIEKKLKNKVDRIILSEKLKNLKFDRLDVSDSTEYLNRVLSNTFFDIIKLSGISPAELTVCVTDRYGENTDFVKRLVEKSAIIKIITENKNDYSALSTEIYSEFGTELVFSNREDYCKIGINFDLDTKLIWFKNPKNSIEISKNCIKLSNGISSFVPKGIYDCDFANELRAYREFRRLNFISAEYYKKNGYLFKINQSNIEELFNEKPFKKA